MVESFDKQYQPKADRPMAGAVSGKLEMKVILLPKFYGHCPGLKRSLRIADELILESKKDCNPTSPRLRGARKIYYDVPLAHNEEVEKRLKKGGFKEVNIDEIKDGKSQYFLISAHGASPAKIALLESKNYVIKSAVCPTVEHVQKIAMADHAAAYKIVIFGKKDHPEIKGVNGCVSDSSIVVSHADDGLMIKLDQKTSVICQTTISSDKFAEFVQNLKKSNPKVEIITRNTICPIVEDRVRKCSAYVETEKPDLVVVVGSKTSSNTKQLASKLSKIVPTLLVADEEEIKEEDFKNIKTVLVVSGTSAPPEIVERVAERLRTYERRKKAK
ncbi:MAG: hypothetical protein Q7S80_02400 [bacterium]|nr:hypothetical protein [bacterium]